jgi:DNA-binding transcriptional regulator YhcF (GntR family)
MIITTSPPKYVQVADYLRNKIVSGELHPGTRLNTFRNLASQFSVSRQIIENSFDCLEKENYIIRNGRKGVYVNDRNSSAGKSMVYFLAYDVTPDNRYLKEIIKMTCPPYLRENCMFNVRIIPGEMASERMLDEEIARISSTVGISCILVLSALSDDKIARKLTGIKTPLIFIGDFKKKEIRGVKYNQVAYDISKAASDCAKYLIGKNHKHIALFIGSQKHYFNSAFADGLRTQALLEGAKVTLLEIPSKFPAEKLDGLYREKLSTLVRGGESFDAVMFAGYPQGSIIRILNENGLRVPQDVSVLSTYESNEESINCVENNFSVLFEGVYNRIETLKDENDFKRQVLEMPFKIINKGTVKERGSK